MPHFSANLGFLWNQLPLIEAIESASKAGFKAVELHFPYATPAQEVRTKCAELGIRLLGINTNVSNDHKGLGAVPGAEAAFRSLATQALDWAHSAGGTSVHIMAGLVPADQHEIAKATFVENLKWAAPRAAERGLTLLLEPLNTTDMPGCFYSRAHQAAEIIDLAGQDNVKLMFDAYHVGIEGDDIVRTLKQYWPIIGHVQLAAVPSRQEPDEGIFDYRELFSALDGLGYDGWVGCEYRPRASVEEGLVWTEKLGVSL